jgi:hypothetical protein
MIPGVKLPPGEIRRRCPAAGRIADTNAALYFPQPGQYN